MRRLTATGLTLYCLTVFASSLSAQTEDRFSLQGSALGNIPFAGGLSQIAMGPGFELQIRYNPSAFSIGGGFELSSHSVEGNTEQSMRLSGAFIEPRYVFDTGSNVFVPYASTRFAVSQVRFEVEQLVGNAAGFTANVGGGLLFVVGSRYNLDLGLSIGLKALGIATVPSTPPSRFDLGSGLNMILRVGLAMGLGG